jgi:hypothetical protein
VPAEFSTRAASEVIALDVFEHAAGEPCQLHRYELPDGHPLSPPAGHPSDCLVLGAHDVLRIAE